MQNAESGIYPEPPDVGCYWGRKCCMMTGTRDISHHEFCVVVILSGWLADSYASRAARRSSAAVVQAADPGPQAPGDPGNPALLASLHCFNHLAAHRVHRS